MSDPGRVLLDLAALGPEIDFATADAVAGLPREQLLDILDAGRRGGLLSIDKGGLRFIGGARERLLESQGAGARAAAHSRSAAVLERTGELALKIYDWETAAARFGRAAELIADHYDARYGQLQLRRARALYSAGMYTGAMEACRHAARVGRLLGDSVMLAESALVIRGVDGREMCAEMLDMVRAASPGVHAGSPLQARLLAQEAMLMGHMERQPANRDTAAEALRIAEESKDPRALIEALHSTQMALSGPAEATRRLALADRVEALAHEAGLEEYLRWPLGWRLDSLWLLGRRPGLDEAIGRLEELGRNRNDSLALWKALVSEAALAQAEGRFDQALELAERAHVLAERGGHDMGAFIYRIFRSQHEILTGGSDGQDHRIRDFPRGGELIAIYPGMEAAVRGELETARVFLDVAWPHREKAFGHDLELSIMWAFAVTIAALERADLAGEIRQYLSPYAEMMAISCSGQAGWAGPVALSMARMSALMQDEQQREDDFARALRRSIEFNDRVALAHARWEWAAALIRRGVPRDRERAASLLEGARRDAAALGMSPLLDKIEAGMASLRSAPSHPLSSRELEVARLVAGGLSNKEIAARLGLSVRTAENHLLNVMNKLGMSNRAQVAAWVARLEGASPRP